MALSAEEKMRNRERQEALGRSGKRLSMADFSRSQLRGQAQAAEASQRLETAIEANNLKDAYVGGISEAASSATRRNESQYDSSRGKVTGAGRAQAAIDQVEDNVGSADRVAGLDVATDQMSNYYRNLGKKNRVGLFGDFFNPNFKVPSFESAGTPSEIKVDYDD